MFLHFRSTVNCHSEAEKREREDGPGFEKIRESSAVFLLLFAWFPQYSELLYCLGGEFEYLITRP